MNDPRATPPDRGGLPDELRDRLAREEDRTELDAVWEILAAAEPAVDAGNAGAEAREDWEAVARRLSLPGAGPDAAPGDGPSAGITPLRRRPAFLPAAAAAVALLLAGGVAWSMVPVTVRAEPGERVATTLPGGTLVELNAGSELRHPRGFAWLPGLPRDERVVTLEGEGFFRVEADGRPFRVRTFNARVTVLGTRFNVRAREEVGGGTFVAVDEGRVRLEGRAGAGTPARSPEVVVLSAGEASAVELDAGEPQAPRTVGADRVASWLQGGLTLVDRPLPSVFLELERRYGVEIRIREGALAGTRPLSLYYSEPVELERVLEDVCTAQELGYRRTAGGWEVF